MDDYHPPKVFFAGLLEVVWRDYLKLYYDASESTGQMAGSFGEVDEVDLWKDITSPFRLTSNSDDDAFIVNEDEEENDDDDDDDDEDDSSDG